MLTKKEKRDVYIFLHFCLCKINIPNLELLYAERFAERWRGIPGHPYEQGFDIKMWLDRLGMPLTWKKPRLIFVNSMSDLFHPEVPDEFIKAALTVMEQADWHQFQLGACHPLRENNPLR